MARKWSRIGDERLRIVSQELWEKVTRATLKDDG